MLDNASFLSSGKRCCPANLVRIVVTQQRDFEVNDIDGYADPNSRSSSIYYRYVDIAGELGSGSVS